MTWQKALFILLVTTAIDQAIGQEKERVCEELNVDFATVSCTRGNDKGSKCNFVCDDGYNPSASSPKTRRCRCRSSGCKWSGNDFACEAEQTSSTCSIPDYSRASLGVLDSWPGGAILRVNIRPKADTTSGWTVVLKLSRPFPAEATLDSGHVKIKERSEDGLVLKLFNEDHNKDIHRYQVYSIYIMVKKLPEDMPPQSLIGLAGFYDSKVKSPVDCIVVPSPVKPIATESPIFTVAPVTPTPRPTPTIPPSTDAPLSTTTPPVITRGPTVEPPPAGCEVIDNNGAHPGYVILNPGWTDGDDWVFNARAEAFADESGRLNNWVFKLEFDKPVSRMEVYVGNPEGPLHGGYVWLIHPKSFNKENQEKLQILFMARITGGSAAPEEAKTVTTFCRDGAEPSKDREGTFGGTEPPVTESPVSTTRDPGLIFTRPITQAPDTDRCASTSPDSVLPQSSDQTDATVGFTPSPDSHHIHIDDLAMDYNEVLHASLLFYEAQRSGKLPADNRIPWRGDSGLKDGCDVGIDLSGGYYDAGDNVKFGYPMAWAVTTVAWSAIQFRESYTRAGLHDRVEEMIKWGTDYFMKAHPEDNVFFAQVTDARIDHSSWSRPEDRHPPHSSYKIDKNNGGSDIAAETAAALAAASLVFKNTDPTYSALCLAHAKSLFHFADTVRRTYHTSVPEAQDYYRSWNGYEDELQWGLAWLAKATGEDWYLTELEKRYSSHVPTEFSWDTKTPGTQILLAELTGNQKYRDDVVNFMDKVMYEIPRNEGGDGITWLRKWGPNRYAANFAAIAVFAAELEVPKMKQVNYVVYASEQIRYMLGDNQRKSSYVIGLGQNPPQRPHHRGSSCPTWRRNSLQEQVPPCNEAGALDNPLANPHVLFGALVGGPDMDGNYVDDRRDYVANEVALDYNAGFTAAVAGLEFFNIESELSG